MKLKIKTIISYSKVLLINFTILYFLLYAVEIGINYKNKQLFQKTRLHYLNQFKKEDPKKEIYLNFGTYKLLDRKNNILPLSGYKNSTILLCLDEKNKPVYYFSDKNGFNNNKNYKKYDILLIGDSYVQGMCVNNKNNLNSQFGKFNFKTVSLGVGGNGPLIELASFKEYESEYKYKNLILFITLDNDFYDLSNERKNKILMKYLNHKDFKQNISNYKNEKAKKNILDSYFGKKTDRFFNDFFSVYHFNLKQVGNLIENLFKNKSISDDNYYYFNDAEIDKLYFEILNQFNSVAKNKKINFYIVFNSTTPNIIYPKTKEEKKFKKIIQNKLLNYKLYLDKKNIKYFDFNDFLLRNYNKKNISKIFKKINNRWDHYSEEGYYILTKEIVAGMKKIQ